LGAFASRQAARFSWNERWERRRRPRCDQEAGAVPEVSEQHLRLNLTEERLEGHQHLALRDVRWALAFPLAALALVNVERQALERLPDALLADTQSLRDPGLDHGLALRSADVVRPLLAPEQELDDLLVELGAVVRELSPARMQRRHEGQEERARGQIAQIGAVAERIP
jgi:hypothetical protein